MENSLWGRTYILCYDIYLVNGHFYFVIDGGTNFKST